MQVCGMEWSVFNLNSYKTDFDNVISIKQCCVKLH
jgi:hypothetical protein